MNSKTAKLLRKIAPRMEVSVKSAKEAFNKLDPLKQKIFVIKARERLEYYDKRRNQQTMA